MKKLQVLIAEDSAITRRLLCAALETSEFEVVETVDGIEAWEVLSGDDAPRLAILDWQMPGLTGTELCHALRNRKSGPYVYTIILTATEKTRLIEGLESGADDFLSKPFDPHELLQRLRSGTRILELEDRLSKAQLSLQEKNRVLTTMCETAQRFVDNVSHEFRTPLTVINEYVSLLRDGGIGNVQLDQDQCRFLDIVRDRADDLNIMVDDMLDISKLETGLLGTWKKTCSIQHIFERVRPLLEKKAAVRDTALSFAIAPDVAEVFCDPEKAGRVIVNLAINAIKFSGPHGDVSVWARNGVGPSEVVIGVTDNGPGISSEEQQVIFDRFHQLEASVAQSCKGFGLGLNIACELVDMNFGKMEVDSKPGSGSTFSFTLPIAEPEEIVTRYLGWLERNNSTVPSVSLVRVQADEMIVNSTIYSELDAFLNYVTRSNELLIQHDDQWLFLIPSLNSEAAEFIARVEDAARETNRNRPQGPLPNLQCTIVLDCVNGTEVARINQALNCSLPDGVLA